MTADNFSRMAERFAPSPSVETWIRAGVALVAAVIVGILL